jgi:hypothetical protein
MSSFVGGIKKKHSPTSAFETNNVPHSVFDQNCFSIFLLKVTSKVWKEFFEQNRSVRKFVFQMPKWERDFF